MTLLAIAYIIFAILITLYYAVLVLYYLLGWQSISHRKASGRDSSTKITVIVAARNEQDNIERLLRCLRAQSYSKEFFEVIVVDDHSDDLTPDLVENFDMNNLHLIHLQEYVNSNEIAFKKRAVEVAVKQSIGELIVTTDADCIMGPNWLYQIADFYEETQSKFIVAPVDYSPVHSILDILQTLDFLSIMGVTGASIQQKIYNLSNGANMAYERQAFLEVNGYHQADKTPSGDDVFLVEKMGRKFPHQINYLKNREAIVYTTPCATFYELFQQRIRWISKTKHYTNIQTKLIAFLLLLFYISVAASFALTIVNISFINILFMQLILKAMVDYALLDEVTRFFKKRKLLKHFFLLELVHLPFHFATGIASQFSSYTWKKRTFKE